MWLRVEGIIFSKCNHFIGRLFTFYHYITYDFFGKCFYLDMKEWIFSIIVSVLITTIISIICPDGRLGQIIKCIFSIVLVLIVIKPVLNTNRGAFFIDNDFMIEKEISKDYLIYVYDVKSKSLSIECEELLSENNIKNSNVTIKYSIDDNYEFNVQIVSNKLKVYR